MTDYNREVNPEELLHYYNSNDITNFPKRKNGYPNMNYKFNKEYVQIIIDNRKKEYLEKRNKREKLIQEFYENYTNDKSESECIICCEKINKNIAILECGHTFCLSCMVKHGRENNNCPCCRIEFTTKPKKVVHMQIMTMREIVNTHMNRRIQHRGFTTIPEGGNNEPSETVYQFIINKIQELQYLSATNPLYTSESIQARHHIVSQITTEISNISKDVAMSIINWYKS